MSVLDRGLIAAFVVPLGCGSGVAGGVDASSSDTGSVATASTIDPTVDATSEAPETGDPDSSSTTGEDDGSTSDDSAESEDDGGEEGDAICPYPARGEPDPCAGGECFEMCGTRVRLDFVPDTPGAVDISMPPRRRYPTARVVHVGDVAVHGEDFGLTVRDDAGTALVRVPFVGDPIAVVDNVVLTSGLRLVDLELPIEPILHPRWSVESFSNDPAPVHLGVARGSFVFATEGGISFVDATDPAMPFEADCIPIPYDPEITPVGVTEDVLVRLRLLGEGNAPPPRVFIHDFDAADPVTPSAELPFGNEARYAFEGTRLMLEEGQDMVLYDLGDANVVEVGRRTWDYQVDTGPPVVAGLALVSQSEDGMSYAIDLRADGDPSVYEGPRLEPSDYGPECLLTFTAVEGGGPAIAASPWYEPSLRFDPAEPPVHACAIEPSPPPWGYRGTRSPDGGRIAVESEDGSVVLDLASGATELVGEGEPAAWTAGGLMLVSSYKGDASGSDLSIREGADPSLVIGELASRGYLHGVAASANRLWMLSRGGEPPGPLEIIWSFANDDYFAPQIDAAVPDDATLDAIAAGPTEIYGIDDDARVFVFDESGALLREIEMPHGVEPDNVAASALGLFVRGSDGVLQWLSAGTDDVLAHDLGCSEWRPRAADGQRVFVASTTPGGATWSSVRSILTIEPTPSRPGEFTTGESSVRVPIDGRVLLGEPLVLLAGTPIIVP